MEEPWNHKATWDKVKDSLDNCPIGFRVLMRSRHQMSENRSCTQRGIYECHKSLWTLLEKSVILCETFVTPTFKCYSGAGQHGGYTLLSAWQRTTMNRYRSNILRALPLTWPLFRHQWGLMTLGEPNSATRSTLGAPLGTLRFLMPRTFTSEQSLALWNVYLPL